MTLCFHLVAESVFLMTPLPAQHLVAERTLPPRMALASVWLALYIRYNSKKKNKSGILLLIKTNRSTSLHCPFMHPANGTQVSQLGPVQPSKHLKNINYTSIPLLSFYIFCVTFAYYISLTCKRAAPDTFPCPQDSLSRRLNIPAIQIIMK